MKKSQFIFTTILILLVFGLGYYAYYLNQNANKNQKNTYDYSFSELVNCINNIENYLAKSMISKSPIHSAETLTKIWGEANLAIVYFENIPFDDKGTNQSIKFLNQVSDYSYTLSRKNINNEELTDEDFKNLKTLHTYCVDLKNTLNELSLELSNSAISWKDLESKSSVAFADEEDINIFSSIESNFDDYEGLIYDGAYSNYIVKNVKLGLVGEDINEETAKEKAIEFVGKDKVEDIVSNGEIVGGDIEAYSFTAKVKDRNEKIDIDISKKGGWILQITDDRTVADKKISENDAIQKGKEYLASKGYSNMKETYYIKNENIITVNYAYQENDIVMYPDLIKVKIALDNGDILGLEATGYLNAHTTRNFLQEAITIEEAKSKLNPNLEILSEGKAVIPLDNNKEVFCYEFKGKIEGKEFLVYINAQTGEEEEILVILETEGGVLTI